MVIIVDALEIHRDSENKNKIFMILLKYYVDYIHKTQECEQIPNYSKINDESSIGEGTKWSGNNGK